MPVINTNVNSLTIQQALNTNQRTLSQSIQQLSTGTRVNSAADDAAGLAISNKMTSQIKGLNQAVRNANDGISMLQTADGASQEITNMLQRMRELAVQSVNGTNSSNDRTSLNKEFQDLQKQIANITKNTSWNGTKVLSGAGVIKYQVGSGSGQVITATFTSLNTSAVGLYVSAASEILSATSASGNITKIDSALTAINDYRSTIGSKINRLVYAADNASNVSMNQAASRSRILDTDYAKATSELARAQIIQEAGTAMLSQANQMPATVLALLK